MAYTLPKVDPSNPALPAPIFGDVSAARGDHLRVNNNYIWQNFDALAALFGDLGGAIFSNRIRCWTYSTGDVVTIIQDLTAQGTGLYVVTMSNGCTGLPIEFASGTLVCHITVQGPNYSIIRAQRLGLLQSWIGIYNAGVMSWSYVIDAKGCPPTASFDIVIDSDAKLAAWAAGGSFPRVLIKAGTWTLASGGVNLTAAGTKVVEAEPGSLLTFSSSANGLYYTTAPTTAEYHMRGVVVRVTPGGGSAFYKCVNLFNCSGSVAGSSGVGFNLCSYLINCNGSGPASGTGFALCDKLTFCTGTGGTGFSNCTCLTACAGSGAAGGGVGYGFLNCTQITNCQGVGTGATGYGYYGCKKCVCNKALSASTTATYNTSYADAGTSAACADTAAGGWNS